VTTPAQDLAKALEVSSVSALSRVALEQTAIARAAMSNAAIQAQATAAQRVASMWAASNAAQQSLKIAADINKTFELLSKQLATTNRTIQAAARIADKESREELSHLSRKARKLTHGKDVLTVEVLRLVAHIAKERGAYSAATATQALSGDEEALEAFTELAQDGDALAVSLLDLISRLAVFTLEVAALIEEAAQAVAPYVLATVETFIPSPPRTVLAGSIERAAP